MKALIISDKQDVIKLLTKRFEKDGFDIIVYRWLIKALDNVEEIRPDFIILSAEEYPRQWKTLASYVQSGIGGNDVRFCLYKDDFLSADDKQKAEMLGVEFYSELREEIVEDTEEVEETEVVEESDSVPTVEGIFQDNQQNVEDITKNYSVIFTNPITKKFVLGSSTQVSFDTFECNVDLDNLSMNQIVDYITVSDDTNCISFSGEVVSLSEKTVSFKVIKYYEK